MAFRQIIAEFSGVYSEEGWNSSGEAIRLNFREMQGTSCYLSAAARKNIEKAIESLPCRAIHWIDTGDYHYMSALWLKNLASPAHLLLFDNHPDDQVPVFGPDILSCGSWVLEARSNPMVKTCTLIRNSSDYKPGLLPQDAEVYLSIDLDVLSRDFARTNWDQGSMTLQELFACIDSALSGRRLAGVDICGGITIEQGAAAEDLAINFRSRRMLEEHLLAYLQ